MMNKQNLTAIDTQSCNVIILAGGNSSRMNFPKAWLPFDDETTILEKLVNLYSSMKCEKIVVVLNSKFTESYTAELFRIKTKATVVENNNPEKGRLYSIKLGIGALPNSKPTFIQNVDNPLVDSSVLNALAFSTPEGYSRPVCNGKGGHPILVNKTILNRICAIDENMILRDLLSNFSRKDVIVENESVLKNINTPDEYLNSFGIEVPEQNVLSHVTEA